MSANTKPVGRPGETPLLQAPSPDRTDAGADKAADAGQEDVRPRDGMCGVLTWRPSWLQWAADIRVFTFVLSMMNLFSGLNLIYYTAVITQIEKRFGLTSSVTGFLKNADNIGFFLTVIIVSHFCRHSNKPRLFAIATVINSFAVFLFAVPHFMYGAGTMARSSESSSRNETESVDSSMYCSANSAPASAASMEDRCRTSGSGLFTYNAVAVAIFTVASILQGMANSPTVALGITYLDDNADDSPKYFGVMFAVRALSPVLAFLLGAWANSKYVDLTDPGIDQRDPRWVGAWWLGFVICSGLVLLSALPMVFFPPHLEQGGPVVKEDKSLLANAKDLPCALLRLVKNPLYMVVLLAVCFDVYLMGYMTFLPKYIELHFGQTASFASLLTGIIMALAWSTGPVISGRVIGRRKISAFITMKIVVIISILSVTGFLVLMFLGCPHQPWTGPVKKFKLQVGPQAPCNLNCTCDSRIFSPVCGSNGVNYVSACYAGCSGTTVANSTTVLSECSCIAPPADGTVNPGKCDFQCGSILVAYAVVLFVTSFVTSMYIIPSFTVIMRCVSYKDKALAIALAVSIMQILVFPAPMVFGLAIDGTCLLNDTSCSAKGACLVYHNTKFRYRLHGLTVILKGLATIMYCIGLFLSRKVVYSDEELEVKVQGKGETAGEEMVALKESSNGNAA